MVSSSIRFFGLMFSFLLILNSFVIALEIRSGSVADVLCPRDTGLFTDFVVNTGESSSGFSVNTQGAADVWSTSVPTGFSLGSGEQKVVYTYVTPGKNAVPGTYSLDVIISGGSESKTISHPVTIKSCYGAELSSSRTEEAVCPLETVKYNFVLTNSGEYRDTFDLKVEGQIANKISLSDSLVTLDPGKSKEIIVFVTGPSEANKFDFTIVAKGQGSGIVESFGYLLNVKSCFDFDVEVEKTNYDFCEHSVVKVPIKLRNLGTSVNEYDILVDGPQWVTLDKDYTKLGIKQKDLATMLFVPDYGINGPFKVGLEVIPKKGEVKAVHNFNVNVRKCNDVSLEIAEEKVRLCNGLDSQYEAIIKNTGENTHEFVVDLIDPPDWLSFNEIKPTFTLEPNEIKKLFLKATPGMDVVPKAYPVSVKVKSLDESSVTAFAEDKIEIETVDVNSCYNPSLEIENDDIVVYEDATSTIPITINNNGISSGSFNLVISGTASNFVQITPSILKIDPGKSEVAYLYIAPSSQIGVGDYELVVSVRLENSEFLESKKITIEVTDNPEDATVTEQIVEKEVSSVNGKLSNYYSTLKEKFFNYKFQILGILLVLILLVLLIFFWKKIYTFYTKEVKEDIPVIPTDLNEIKKEVKKRKK